jgi:hypothetical protein
MALPVSGLQVRLRPPSGVDDLMLHESDLEGPSLALALVQRLASGGDGSADWAALPVPDLEALLVRVRQLVFGDAIDTHIRCTNAACRSPMDVSFRLGDYLAHHVPRLPRGVEAADEPGWYRIRGTEVTFRVPTVGDQIAALLAADPAREVAARCIRPAGATARQRRHAERALSALAPSLSRELEADCPECGGHITFYFDVPRFVLAEFRLRASRIYADVHDIAHEYGWSEAEILALPGYRRERYAELARSEARG